MTCRPITGLSLIVHPAARDVQGCADLMTERKTQELESLIAKSQNPKCKVENMTRLKRENPNPENAFVCLTVCVMPLRGTGGQDETTPF